MKKKLISTLTALTLTLSSMVALTSNAAIFIYDSDSDEYQDILDDYSPIDTDIAKSYFHYWNSIDKNDKFYSNENCTSLIAVRQLSSIVVFDPADGVSLNEINNVIRNYCDTEFSYYAEKRSLTGFVEPDYGYEMYKSGGGNLSGAEYSVKTDDAKNICKVLKEKNLISGFKYVERNQVTYLDSPCTDYPLTTYTLPASEAERSFLVRTFMAENFPDYEMRVTDDEYCNQTFQFIPPNENASVEEIMEFSVKINEAYSDYIGNDKYSPSVCHGGYFSP